MIEILCLMFTCWINWRAIAKSLRSREHVVRLTKMSPGDIRALQSSLSRIAEAISDAG